MDGGYKHFSHAHNLIMHQIHEAANMSCSGCYSFVTGTMFVCWQCNFVLHDQCFRATRSLKHPSHPSHPLTLLPYPTYPSNSFYCNSCKITGTGLSYSCSDCEFDLHVRCAHSFTTQTHGQEMVSQGVEHPYMHGQHVGFVSAQSSAHNLITNPQYPSMAPNMRVEECASTKDSDLEHIKMNRLRLEIAREEYRIAAIGRQNCLDSI